MEFAKHWDFHSKDVASESKRLLGAGAAWKVMRLCNTALVCKIIHIIWAYMVDTIYATKCSTIPFKVIVSQKFAILLLVSLEI
jgi:uncharacterized UBP type Zn finger protein